ncbi:hypothetical protein HK103_007468 [Boothiomyces macroporosus]|uniref:SLC41A/MgtE integral membrane domain-containing protein n=1 Tax=Boothiomyces macroporosus TaxID=261099 RepID=A0AAD5Y1G6_9FUNG|nr:hypothetical protein HK103_007468 [Boothiomyces macroporosus]
MDTATLRALSTGHAKNTLSGVLDVVTKESLSAIIISVVSALSIFFVAQIWSHALPFATATALAILFNSIIAGCMGSLGPLLFKRLGIDPALMAGPFETALQDLIGTTVYLSLATLFLPNI